ncbi:MAG: hypothetical protein JSS62_05340 [Verrucomicrobia bacterium]|nr:hypothetical protein [Verrucomicrobiota bacterium]MBS0647269.1 hypothetical protein [Verrucomicrobiota bacterium]
MSVAEGLGQAEGREPLPLTSEQRKYLSSKKKLAFEQESVLRARIALFDQSGCKAVRWHTITAIAVNILGFSIVAGLAVSYLLPIANPIPVWGGVLICLGAIIIFGKLSSYFSRLALIKKEAYQTDLLALELLKKCTDKMPHHLGDVPATDARIPWHRQEEDSLKRQHPLSPQDLKSQCDRLGLDVEDSALYAAAQRSCSLQSSSGPWREIRQGAIKANRYLLQKPGIWVTQQKLDGFYYGDKIRALQRAYIPSVSNTWTEEEKRQVIPYLIKFLGEQGMTFHPNSCFLIPEDPETKQQLKRALRELLFYQDEEMSPAELRIHLCAREHLKVCLKVWKDLDQLYANSTKLLKEMQDLDATYTDKDLFTPLKGLDLSLQQEELFAAQLHAKILQLQIDIVSTQQTQAVPYSLEQTVATLSLLGLQGEQRGGMSPEEQVKFQRMYLNLLDMFVDKNDLEKSTHRVFQILKEKLRGPALVFIIPQTYQAIYQSCQESFNPDEYWDRFCRSMFSVLDQTSIKEALRDPHKQRAFEEAKKQLGQIETFKQAMIQRGLYEHAFEKMQQEILQAPAEIQSALQSLLAHDRTILARYSSLCDLAAMQWKKVQRNMEEGLAARYTIPDSLDGQELLFMQTGQCQFSLSELHTLRWQAIPKLDRQVLELKASIAQLEEQYHAHQAQKVSRLEKLEKRLQAGYEQAVRKQLEYLQKQQLPLSLYLQLLDEILEKNEDEFSAALLRAWARPKDTIGHYRSWKQKVQGLDPFQAKDAQQCRKAVSRIHALLAEIPAKAISLDRLENFVRLALVQDRLLQGHRDEVKGCLKVLRKGTYGSPQQWKELLGHLERNHPEHLKKALGQAWSIDDVEDYHRWKQRLPFYGCSQDYEENGRVAQDKAQLKSFESRIYEYVKDKKIQYTYRKDEQDHVIEIDLATQYNYVRPDGTVDQKAFMAAVQKNYPVFFDQMIEGSLAGDVANYRELQSRLRHLYSLQDLQPGGKRSKDAEKFYKLLERIEPCCLDLQNLKDLLPTATELPEISNSLKADEFEQLQTWVLAQPTSVVSSGRSAVGQPHTSSEQRQQLTSLCQTLQLVTCSDQPLELPVCLQKQAQRLPLHAILFQDLKAQHEQFKRRYTDVYSAEKQPNLEISSVEKEQQRLLEADLSAYSKKIDKFCAQAGYRGTLTFGKFIRYIVAPFSDESFFSLRQEELTLAERVTQRLESHIPSLDRSRRITYLYLQVLLVRVVVSLAFALTMYYVPNVGVQIGLLLGWVPLEMALSYPIDRLKQFYEKNITQRRLAVHLYQPHPLHFLNTNRTDRELPVPGQPERVEVEEQGPIDEARKEASLRYQDFRNKEQVRTLDGWQWTLAQRLMQTPEQQQKERLAFQKTCLVLYVQRQAGRMADVAATEEREREKQEAFKIMQRPWHHLV